MAAPPGRAFADVEGEAGDFVFAGSHGWRHAVKAPEVEQKSFERALEA
jgi:hypothetical protein